MNCKNLSGFRSVPPYFPSPDNPTVPVFAFKKKKKRQEKPINIYKTLNQYLGRIKQDNKNADRNKNKLKYVGRERLPII